MTPDPVRVAAIIAGIAEKEMLPHYRRLAPGAVRTKESPSDLVTIVDEAVEKALRAALEEIAPDALFIGEEAAAKDASIVASAASAPKCWIVDPLDGTRNFVGGVNEFGTIVAYVEKGRTLGGWIHAAPLKAAALASRGSGVSWMGAPVETKPQAGDRPRGLRSTGWLKPDCRERIVANLKSSFETQPGHCSAYAYLKLLSGEVDFKLSSRIHPWDHAAGALMLEELGGEVRWLDTGEPYAPADSADRPLLATAPGRNWREIADGLLA